MMDRPIFHGNFDALQPLWTAIEEILLEEPFLGDSAVVSLHRDRTAADVRQHDTCDRFVVRRELALGDAVVREQHLFRVCNHCSRTTSRGDLSMRRPVNRAWR